MNAYLTYDRIEDRRWAEQQLTASTATPYQLSVAKNATNQFPSRGALPFPAARHVRSARA